MMDSINILIINGDADSALLIETTLELVSVAREVHARDVSQAMTILDHWEFDVVVLDWTTDEADQQRLLARIKHSCDRQNAHTAALMISECEEEDDELLVELLSRGIDDYLCQTASPGEMASRLYSLARLTDVRNQLASSKRSTPGQAPEVGFAVAAEASKGGLVSDVDLQQELAKQLHSQQLQGELQADTTAVADSNTLAPFCVAQLSLKPVQPRAADASNVLAQQLAAKAANRIAALIRDTDLVAHIGELQFAVLIRSSINPQTCEKMFGRIIKALAQQPLTASDELVPVNVGVGVVLYEHHSNLVDAQLLQEQGERACRQACSSGSNQLVCTSSTAVQDLITPVGLAEPELIRAS